MYTVLIVEDEDIIRRGIRNSVPWETFGCTVVGEARNGEEGAADRAGHRHYGTAGRSD